MDELFAALLRKFAVKWQKSWDDHISGKCYNMTILINKIYSRLYAFSLIVEDLLSILSLLKSGLCTCIEFAFILAWYVSNMIWANVFPSFLSSLPSTRRSNLLKNL